tara:strand:+ start:55 stop:489 length:435 start_codon:yes stop_codon:yes gene_type:complete
MIIFRGKTTKFENDLEARRVTKILKYGKYNGYVYITCAITRKPGHTIILRIGETSRSERGLNTYRPVRSIREWKQADGKQTNMLGKFYARKDLVIFIFPTKIPYEQKTLEAKFKQKHMIKHGKSPTFDKDSNYQYLINNDKWTN